MQIKEKLGNQDKKLFKYFCESCNFKCFQKIDWDRHIARPKHLGNLGGNLFPKPNKNHTDHICSCSKVFKTASGLWKHKKTCEKTLSDIGYHNVLTLSDNLDTDKDKDIIAYLMNQNTIQNNMILELLKSGTNNVYNNNYYNNENNNNNNKTFNMQFFLNETCKNAMNISDFVNSIEPTLEDLENVGRVGYVKGISDIIINNLNKIEATDRPFHCSDLKREILYVKNEDVWSKETEDKPILLKAIKDIAFKNMQNISQWKEMHPGCTQADSKKNDLFLNIVSNSMCGLTKEESTKNFSKIISNLSKKVTIADYK